MEITNINGVGYIESTAGVAKNSMKDIADKLNFKYIDARGEKFNDLPRNDKKSTLLSLNDLLCNSYFSHLYNHVKILLKY